MERERLARAYYEAIDAAEYDRLAALLAAEFVHSRPDRTVEGRDAFVRFMREERPETDTTHEVETVYGGRDGVAVRGRLHGADGSTRFEFVDVFAVEADRLAELTTYTA